MPYLLNASYLLGLPAPFSLVTLQGVDHRQVSPWSMAKGHGPRGVAPWFGAMRLVPWRQRRGNPSPAANRRVLPQTSLRLGMRAVHQHGYGL